MYTAAVITVSDKGYAGERVDTGGPLVCDMLKEAGYELTYTALVPDEIPQIAAELKKCADELDIALAVTTGGTGFSPRDVTPEATISVCERLAPGIPEAMQWESLKITKRAMLSRAQAGIRGQTLIVNLPGSPKACMENMDVFMNTIPHAMGLLRSAVEDCAQL